MVDERAAMEVAVLWDAWGGGARTGASVPQSTLGGAATEEGGKPF